MFTNYRQRKIRVAALYGVTTRMIFFIFLAVGKTAKIFANWVWGRNAPTSAGTKIMKMSFWGSRRNLL
jgi:hypothetical protein